MLAIELTIGSDIRLVLLRATPFLSCFLRYSRQKNVLGTGADQFSSDRTGADFPRGEHWCATKELTKHCSSTTVVGYDLIVSRTKLLLTVLHLAF